MGQEPFVDPGDGRRIYEKFVKPAMVDLPKVADHYAIRSLFRPYEEHDRIYCYTADLMRIVPTGGLLPFYFGMIKPTRMPFAFCEVKGHRFCWGAGDLYRSGIFFEDAR